MNFFSGIIQARAHALIHPADGAPDRPESVDEPPVKRSTASSSLFGHWNTESTTAGDLARPMKQLTNYIDFINSPMLTECGQ